MKIIAFQFSVAFDVVQFHEFGDIGVAFPASEADFVSSQMDVSIRKHFLPLHEQSLERFEVGLLGGINRSVLSIGDPVLVARSEESFQSLSPRETVT